MFVRRLEDLAGTDKEMVKTDGNKRLQSRRLVTKADGAGFSHVGRQDCPRAGL